MHFPDRRPDQTEERILPLINVVFLLLIFFMIAGSLTVTEPFEVVPPESQSQGEHEPDSVVILMGVNNRFALNNQVNDKGGLLAELRSRLAQQPKLLVTVKAENSLPANQLVRFTQELNDAGLSKLRLLTQEVAQ
jgi:biopolymer transport protein ExbD